MRQHLGAIQPAFDHPPARLHMCNTPLNNVGSVIGTHLFNSNVTLYMPGASGTTDSEKAWQVLTGKVQNVVGGWKVSRGKVPLKWFLGDIRENIIREGKLAAVSCEPLMTHSAFALLATGTLVLNLTKDDYETCGLNGSKSKVSQNRYVVQLDLADPSFKPSSKAYQRALWCFENTFSHAVEFVFSHPSTVSLELPPEAALASTPVSLNITTFSNIHVPTLADLPTLSSKDLIGEETVLSYMEYFGLLHIAQEDDDSNRLNVADNPDPYVCIYSPPDECLSGSVMRIRINADLLAAELMIELMKVIEEVLEEFKLSWLALQSQTYTSSPVAWRDQERSTGLTYSHCGEAGYLALYHPNTSGTADSAEGPRCLIYQIGDGL
ncbi:ribonuclease P 40kDa subunit-domain-containing protein [Gaertneriomyces semiglobifer]|nr:ribonuclease P 40kDa subunit-domain-containing protein [Gaertneriomyces semiglobifer]